MTTNYITSPQIMKMKTEVNHLKIAKETSGSIRLLQRMSPTKLINISFFQFKSIFQKTINIIQQK